jgi:ankyrin repeat protein
LLLEAAAKGVRNKVEKLVLEDGADVDGENSAKETPLFKACQNNKTQIVDFLLNNKIKKANVNWKTKKEETPLHAAVSAPSFICVSTLIENGTE